MLFHSLAFAVFATASLAHQLNDKHMHFHEARGLNVFEARQGGQGFAPPTTTATGDTCAAAFGQGYETCREATATSNRLCFNPSSNQTCCSNTWACPAGAFCLANSNGNCCPNGLDPNTCASIYSSSSAAASHSAVASSNSTTTITSTSTATATLPCLSTTHSNSANGTQGAGPTGKPSPSPSHPTQFTGAASRIELSVAGLVGIAALVAGLL